MKNYKFHLSSIAVLLALLPLIFIGDTTLIIQNFSTIVDTLGGLMSTLIILTLFGLNGSCLTITEKYPGIQRQIDLFAVPIVFLIFLFEMILFYFLNPVYVGLHFVVFKDIVNSMVVAFIINVILNGEYRIAKSKKIEEKK